MSQTKENTALQWPLPLASRGEGNFFLEIKRRRQVWTARKALKNCTVDTNCGVQRKKRIALVILIGKSLQFTHINGIQKTWMTIVNEAKQSKVKPGKPKYKCVACAWNGEREAERDFMWCYESVLRHNRVTQMNLTEQRGNEHDRTNTRTASRHLPCFLCHARLSLSFALSLYLCIGIQIDACWH